MKKDRIAFVVQRYGNEINGGSEYECRVLAEHMTQLYDVDVFTSCAMDYLPWDNYFNEGIEIINGVNVYRFQVERTRDDIKFLELTDRIKSGDTAAEVEWQDEIGPYCPELIKCISEKWREYKAVIFMTYLYYTAARGIGLGLPNAIFVPTAHDESYIYLSVCRKLFHIPGAFIYNSDEERDFLYSQFNIKNIPSITDCVGIDIPDNKKRFLPEKYNEFAEKYILYAGRVSNGKKFRELNKFFIEYKYRNPSDLKLLVVGKIDEGMKITYSKDIIFTGFVTDNERDAIMQNALLLVNPSMYESLSLVILESMAVKRPVLINGRCDVMKGQCIRSNAGLYYTNYFEFEGALNYMLTNKEAYKQMCENGYSYVKERYSWERIVKNVSELIEKIAVP